jgi:hypothetical protein
MGIPFQSLIKIIMKDWWNDNWHRETQVLGEKPCTNATLSTINSVMDHPGISHGPPRQEAGDKPSTVQPFSCVIKLPREFA